MACCPPPPESNILWCFLSGGALLLWLLNPRLGAAATVLLAVLFFWGPWFIAKLDVAVTGCEVALRRRRRARQTGRLCCPECGLLLEKHLDGKPVPHYICPACAGAWCGSEELGVYMSRRQAKWKPDAADREAAVLPCPKCAGALEAGGWAGAPISAHRCPSCTGTWLPRLSWVWLDLEQPRA